MTTANLPEEGQVDRLAGVLQSKTTQRGANLATLSLVSPVLVVFLRHAGCTFCRQTLADLARERARIEAAGTRIVIVHMGSVAGMRELLHRNGLQDLDRITDNDQSLYRSFGLRRGGLWQLAGPKVWLRGIRAALIERHGFGGPDGDVRQMPGAFVLYRCQVVRLFRHGSASDRLPCDELVDFTGSWEREVA